jgi:hypothetical protein
VLFWDDWIPYAQRHEFLAEADIGLTLHGMDEEAHLAARVRYLDYLWAELPCILAAGDDTGARFADAGFATLVQAGEPAGVRDALLSLAGDRGALERAREAAVSLADEFRWPALTEPLARALVERTPVPHGGAASRLTLRLGGYYARRAADHTVRAWERART